MSARLILAILSTLLEEAALVAVVLLGLPRLGIEIHPAGLIALMVAWAAYSIITYRMGSQALRRKPEIALPLVGSKGEVVSPLAPEGLVRIRGELWIAKSAGGETMDTGEEVTVVEQNGLKLTVCKSNISEGAE